MTRSTPADLTNGDLARIFHEIGDMLELKGELVFKTVAYHRAADAIGRSPVDLVSAYRAGNPPTIPGVGKAISDKIRELATTGHMAFYDRLRAEVPPSLVEILRIPGLGPKTVRQLNTELGIETVDDLRLAAEEGRLRTVRGMSARTEALVLEGIARLDDRFDRMRLDRAEEIVTALIDGLGATPGVSVDRTGRLVPSPQGVDRRPRPARRDRPAGRRSIEAFTSFGMVDSVINKGGYKAAVRLMRGPQVDLMVMPPGEAGTYRIHFTGSKEHNVRLRAMARDQGWSLSEKGFLRIGEDGEPLTGDDAELRTFATEAEAYALPRPAVHRTRAARGRRRDRGGAGRPLPALIEPGRPARRPAQPLRLVRRPPPDRGHGRGTRGARGYAYQVLTDHSQSLAIARGLTPDRVAEQVEIIAALNARFAAEEAAGTRPARDTGRWLPAPARLRARDPRRRRARLTRTTCWPGSTSSSHRSMSAAARPGPS